MGVRSRALSHSKNLWEHSNRQYINNCNKILLYFKQRYFIANLKFILSLFRRKYQELISKISLNARGHIEDVSLKFIDININNWFGGADHDVSEEFAADRRHGLRVQRLRRVAFYWGTTSGIDARFLSLRVRVPQHILKV